MISNIIFFILGCYGITHIIVCGKIFNKFRKYLKKKSKFMFNLFNCMMCLSFWVGVIVSLITHFSLSENLFNHNVLTNIFITPFFDGVIVSAIVWFIYLIQLNIEKYVEDKI